MLGTLKKDYHPQAHEGCGSKLFIIKDFVILEHAGMQVCMMYLQHNQGRYSNDVCSEIEGWEQVSKADIHEHAS